MYFSTTFHLTMGYLVANLDEDIKCPPNVDSSCADCQG